MEKIYEWTAQRSGAAITVSGKSGPPAPADKGQPGEVVITGFSRIFVRDGQVIARKDFSKTEVVLAV